MLEDGRVLSEDIPIVTIDSTEDKQIYQTDQDEERDVENHCNKLNIETIVQEEEDLK